MATVNVKGLNHWKLMSSCLTSAGRLFQFRTCSCKTPV